MVIFLENANRALNDGLNDVYLSATILNDFMYFALNGKIYQVDMISGEQDVMNIKPEFLDSPIVKLDLTYSETVFHG